MLFCVDGLASYITAIREVFREPDRQATVGRPHLHSWPGIYIVQVVKQYVAGRVAGVQRRIVQGPAEQVEAVRHQVNGGGVFNTAFIERINATFRGHLAALTRRGRALALRSQTLHHAMYLTGAVYNFCTEHGSLRLGLRIIVGRLKNCSLIVSLFGVGSRPKSGGVRHASY